MVVRNPPIDGNGNSIVGDENENPAFAIGEVRMFSGKGHMRQAGFNVGIYETPIEFRRWTGGHWETVENPKMPNAK